MFGLDPEHEDAEWLRRTFADDDQPVEERRSHWFAVTVPDGDDLIEEIGLARSSPRGDRTRGDRAARGLGANDNVVFSRLPGTQAGRA